MISFYTGQDYQLNKISPFYNSNSSHCINCNDDELHIAMWRRRWKIFIRRVNGMSDQVCCRVQIKKFKEGIKSNWSLDHEFYENAFRLRTKKRYNRLFVAIQNKRIAYKKRWYFRGSAFIYHFIYNLLIRHLRIITFIHVMSYVRQVW